MRRGRIFIYLALIIILGLVAVAVVWFRMGPSFGQQNNPTAIATPVIDTVNVIVVAQKVPRGAVLEAKHLGMLPIERKLFYQGMYSDINEVVGKRAKFDLDAGIFVTSGMLADSAEQLSATGSTAALTIPRGMVAVSVPISRLSAVSYAPMAGDHVNVIVTLAFVDLDEDFQTILPNNAGSVIAPGASAGEGGPNYLTPRVEAQGEGSTTPVGKVEQVPGLGQSVYMTPSEQQRSRIVSQNLLQNAVVLGIGTFDEATPEVQTQGPEAQPAEGEATVEPPKPDVITLIVNPQDAVTLNYLLFSGGQITLALRSAEDDTRVDTQAVTLQFLLSQYNIPVPVKLPYGIEPRVDELKLPVLQNELIPTPAP